MSKGKDLEKTVASLGIFTDEITPSARNAAKEAIAQTAQYNKETLFQ